MSKTVSIGDCGESVAIMKFTLNDCIVSKPLSDNARYDLIIEHNNKLYRVQVKTTAQIKDETKMVFATKTTNYTKGNWQSIGYTNQEVDIFFLYCIENNWCGLYVGEEDGSFKQEITIRLTPTKSNQVKGTRLADDYCFEKQFANLE